MFKQPVRIGELIHLNATINYTGRTSMEVGIQVIAEDLQKQIVRHTNSCYFTMVAIDDNGKSAEIEPLVPETEDDKRRWSEALARREQRQSNG